MNTFPRPRHHSKKDDDRGKVVVVPAAKESDPLLSPSVPSSSLDFSTQQQQQQRGSQTIRSRRSPVPSSSSGNIPSAIRSTPLKSSSSKTNMNNDASVPTQTDTLLEGGANVEDDENGIESSAAAHSSDEATLSTTQGIRHHHAGYQSISDETPDDSHILKKSSRRPPTATTETTTAADVRAALRMHRLPSEASSSSSVSSTSAAPKSSLVLPHHPNAQPQNTAVLPSAAATPTVHPSSFPSGHQRNSSSNSRQPAGRSDYGHHDEADTVDDTPPLLEIPEEIYAVRKAALQVLKPLNKTWVVISVGFALTVLFGMARWTRLLPRVPFWFIVLPCWSAHVGLLWLHILSAKALSAFIAEANDSRQRPDSRDHLNRTEYLPLLQRSLKFGLKTGLLSLCVFLFEILMYIRVARGTVSLGIAFAPLWILVTVGIVDGLICKSQHFLRVVCWMLTFSTMVMTVMKVDYGFETIRWRAVISPVVVVLSIASCSLMYIVYGHQIGYYRLTESQLTAGNLYSLAALICIVLIVMIGEVIPLSRPVEIETRLMVVILAPLVVSLVGMGAWVVSRDEFGRFLLFGGQSAVHPMKLKWEATRGWTSVQGKGVTVIPMFGEVAFQPLEKKPVEHAVEMLNCCTKCYPYEEDDEETMNRQVDESYHPYLEPSSQQHQRSSYQSLRRGGL